MAQEKPKPDDTSTKKTGGKGAAPKGTAEGTKDAAVKKAAPRPTAKQIVQRARERDGGSHAAPD